MNLKNLFTWFPFIKSQEESDASKLGSDTIDVDSKNTSEVRQKIKNKYDKIKCIKEIDVFQKEAINMIINHLMETDYKKHTALLREINFLLHYTFEVLKDDFFLGNKFFKTRMTRIDDYIFSQFSKQENLKANIKKIKILSSSNRFDDKPRQNILSYFVFMEETGFEVIELLNDFYKILDKSQQKTLWTNGSLFKINKEYKKDSSELNSNNEVFQTLMTQQTMAFTPKNAQKEIIEDEILRSPK